MLENEKIKEAQKILKDIDIVKEVLDDLAHERIENGYEDLNNVLTFSEAAELVGITPGYITKLVRENKLIEGRDFRRANGINLIRKNSILEFFKLER